MKKLKKMKGNGLGSDGCLLVQELQFTINNKTFSREQERRGYIWGKWAYPGVEMTFSLNRSGIANGWRCRNRCCWNISSIYLLHVHGWRWAHYWKWGKVRISGIQKNEGNIRSVCKAWENDLWSRPGRMPDIYKTHWEIPMIDAAIGRGDFFVISDWGLDHQLCWEVRWTWELFHKTQATWDLSGGWVSALEDSCVGRT